MVAPVITAKGLKKRFDTIVAVNGIDFEVKQGEIFGLVGADGAGKTTTIQMLCTLALPSEGEARVLGRDTVKQAVEIRQKIGYMSESFNLYPTLSVEENLDFFARLRNVPSDIAEARKKELLGFCRLEPFRRRRAEHLSGGMQKKLALACSLIHEPEVIFLDEPTTGIDPVSRRDFWRIITGFLSRGITVLVSTPYLDEAERFNRVALMHRGQIIACDTPDSLKGGLAGELLEVRARPVRRAVTVLREISFLETPQVFGDTVHVMVDDAGKHLPRMKHLLEQRGITLEEAKQVVPGLEDVYITRLAGLGDRPSSADSFKNSISGEESASEETAISVDSLTMQFGEFTAVDGVSFAVKRGEIFGLLGPNGSGKTTTIRMITGLLKPTSGDVRVLDYDMSLEADVAQQRIGYMSQKFSLFRDLTVEENMNFYGGLYGLSGAELGERKGWVLNMAGLAGKEKSMTSELSGGWKQRLALGCSIMHKPEVVFLDEPTAGVDPLSRRYFWELIQELAAHGTTIFITTHYMDEAEHCHRLGLMYQGKLIALGSPAYLKAERVKGELIEVFSPGYARAFELLSGDERFRHVNLFGSAIHVVVEDADAASKDIEAILGRSGISLDSIRKAPFTMEDVFISLIEEREKGGEPCGSALSA